MSYDTSLDSNKQLCELNAMITTALGQDIDVLQNSGTGFVAVMAKKNQHVRQDVAVASEMYSLLMHFLTKIPLTLGTLGEADTLLTQAVHYDVAAGKVLLLIKVGAGELEFVAHWAVDGMLSNKVKAMAGVMALPFSIEEHGGDQHLIPEWFGAFYVDGNEDHCVPVLTLRSVTNDERFGDWVAVALERMKIFGLPCDAALQSTKQKSS